MTVIILERVSPSLRGELSRWLLEPHAGVFLGCVSAMVRDKLWEHACRSRGSGAAFLAYTFNNEQGFLMRTHGDVARSVVDFEGLSLIRIK